MFDLVHTVYAHQTRRYFLNGNISGKTDENIYEEKRSISGYLHFSRINTYYYFLRYQKKTYRGTP